MGDEIEMDDVEDGWILSMSDGRITIPKGLREKMNLDKDGTVCLTLMDSEIEAKVTPIHKVVAEV